MNVKKYNKLLQEYKNKLNCISKNDVDYKLLLSNAVIIFFNEINKLDKKILENYFKNFNKENIYRNEVQKDALYNLILLTIKNTSHSDLFVRFFPEYLESKLTVKSNWRVVRWLQMFISWIIKPKPKLRNLADAKKILEALRNIKHRIANTENDLLDVNLEMETYKALPFMVEKFLENKVSSLIYTPINEYKLLEEWSSSYKKKLYSGTASDLSKECSDIDSLLNYLSYRIKLLIVSDEKIKLSKELTKLKAFVFDKKFSLFEEKIGEIKEFIKNTSIHKNAVRIGGIYNLIEGIRQRFKLQYEFNEKVNLQNKNLNQLTSEFKQLLSLSIYKMQFCYEGFRKNLDKQVDRCYGNDSNFYQILNKLETIFYINRSLFFHTTNQAFSNSECTHLYLTLDKLQNVAAELEIYAKKMEPKLLETDLTKLSQFILTEVLMLKTALKKEIAENIYPCQYDSDEEEDAWDTDWEDDSSDISVTSNRDQLEQEEDLNKDEAFITTMDSQSDSGISDEAESNLYQPALSTYPRPLFWSSPINNQENTGRVLNSYQQVLMN
ncbi:hypothetical protein A1D18_03695 [Candidatus Rickettsiella isopodorum]|jgi:hypothetical protein|uniref:Uncharacterized protein n=1 Tax=Candidatus Rickettsiella isopodorum TaxID=1225476 RepID=A0A1J8NIM8_9COXI|nr:hypothetical protein [Candidatus Rickettsiella isopodorum]OIZ95209.1 hypothetical protein A1D18_03695 [Candidatus Rickettsiella isopodorum]